MTLIQHDHEQILYNGIDTTGTSTSII
jgi:hypothetical protein